MAKPGREYIYGMNPATEVVNAGKRQVYKAFLDKKRSDHFRMRDLVGILEAKDIPIEWVDDRRITELSNHTDHQGVALKARPYPYQSSNILWGCSRILLLDNVEDPHNVGGILRSAEIFGFQAILLTQKGVPDIHPSIVKTSAGATEFLDIAKDASADEYAGKARENGYQIVALDPEGSIEIREIGAKLSDKVLLVIGGEDRAVSRSVLDMADFVVSIRQSGRINSLNAAIAAGIALFSMQKFE
jgi:23S rRNA (guanosine2251-2'-O)-methyltransferase